MRACVGVLILLLCVPDGAWSWVEGHYRQTPHMAVFSYPRDWETDWGRTQGLARRRAARAHRRNPLRVPEEPVPEYHYQADPTASPLRPRMVVVSPPMRQQTRGVWHSQQRGSTIITHPGATVRVRPGKEYSSKFYKGTVTNTVYGGPSSRSRRNRSHKYRNKESRGYSGDEPAPPRPRVCARCPSDRAVLARKGSITVTMEEPPIIPCHTWASVKNVKPEIIAGPQPGEEVPEGSHKIVIQFYKGRRTLATCATRYNIIVRKCPELDTGPGVRTDCPLGRAWGSRCDLSCDPGYVLEGDSFTECTDDLEWSGVMPTCVPTTSCPVPVAPENGHLSCRTPNHKPVKPKDMLPDGSVCHFLCDPGYSVPPTQENTTRVRCIAGSWDTSEDPVCVENNYLEEEEPEPEITADDAMRFDGGDCPEDFCRNGGKCLTVLGQPLCSCKAGFSGDRCELPPDPDPDLEEANTIT